MQLIPLCVWAEWALLGSAKTALKLPKITHDCYLKTLVQLGLNLSCRQVQSKCN